MRSIGSYFLERNATRIDTSNVSSISKVSEPEVKYNLVV